MTMDGKPIFVTVNEVVDVLGVCQSKAYRIIQNLNKELEEKGYITVRGKVSRRYFEERVAL